MSNTPTQDAPRKRPSPIKMMLFAMTPVLLMLGVAEFAARYYEGSVRPAYWSRADRLSNPAYAGKPWFNERFLTLSMQSGHWFSLQGTRLTLPKDHQDEYFTVVRGERRTTGFDWKPGDPAPVKLFVFGGSTTFCEEVPDSDTWASQLQKQLAASPETSHVRVSNYGVASVNSTQEVDRLEYELATGNIPDICIFYDGVNEVMGGVYNKNPEGTIAETAAQYAKEKEQKKSRFTRIAQKAALYRVLTARPYGNRFLFPHLSDTAQLESLSERSATVYEKNMLRAKSLCDRYGVRMIACLQPQLYAIEGRPLTAFEQSMIDRPHVGVKQCFDTAYPKLREALTRLKAGGLETYDLSREFEKADRPIFIDFCHVETEGNRLIADAVKAAAGESIRVVASERLDQPRTQQAKAVE